MKDNNLLLRKYFEENNFIESNIESYNSFVEWRFQEIIDEVKEAIPAVVPPEVEEVKFRFGNIIIKKPVVHEADGSERILLPNEARLRNLTYSAPVYLEVSLILDGKERESVEVQIADMPVMVKSKLCYLSRMSKDELINAGEDPDEPGGYFIVNGTERLLVLLEDLAPNSVFVKTESSGPSTHSARIFSASDNYRVPLTVERMKDGIFVVSFTTLSRIPFVILMKALGLIKDKNIAKALNMEVNEDLYINLYEFIDIKTQEEAQEFIAKTMHLALPKERKIQRVGYILDNLLFPHLGKDTKNRLSKAFFLGRIINKLFLLKEGKIKDDDKDHYMNKRVRLSGDLLEDLLRTNFRGLVNDMLYIFQRGVRRGRIIPITSIIRTKFLSSRIKSAMATGNWTANRQGVSQRLERDNGTQTLSHLRGVVSLLESTRESFQARALHLTHWGRLGPIESPEGKNIGLRKTLALLASITPKLSKKDVNLAVNALEKLGLSKLEVKNK